MDQGIRRDLGRGEVKEGEGLREGRDRGRDGEREDRILVPWEGMLNLSVYVVHIFVSFLLFYPYPVCALYTCVVYPVPGVVVVLVCLSFLPVRVPLMHSYMYTIT